MFRLKTAATFSQVYGTLLDAIGTIGTAGYWGVEALVAGCRLACLLPGSEQW